MFGFSHFPELIILLVIALVVFGPKRLPEIGGAMGKSIREFRKGTSELANDDKHEAPAQQAQIPQTPAAAPPTASSATQPPASEPTPGSGQARDAG